MKKYTKEYVSIKIARELGNFSTQLLEAEVKLIYAKINCFGHTKPKERVFIPFNNYLNKMTNGKGFNQRHRWESSVNFNDINGLNIKNINLGYEEMIEQVIETDGRGTLTAYVVEAIFDINKTYYGFKNHPPVKAITLQTINNREIELDEEMQENLLAVDLCFCRPSYCRLIMTKKWDCSIEPFKEK